jgi:hypothetical protein
MLYIGISTCSYQIKYKKIKIVKSVKFHVISGVVSCKSGLIYKILRGMNTICISSWWFGWSSKFCGLLIHQRRGDRAVGSGGFCLSQQDAAPKGNI